MNRESWTSFSTSRGVDVPEAGTRGNGSIRDWRTPGSPAREWSEGCRVRGPLLRLGSCRTTETHRRGRRHPWCRIRGRAGLETWFCSSKERAGRKVGGSKMGVGCKTASNKSPTLRTKRRDWRIVFHLAPPPLANKSLAGPLHPTEQTWNQGTGCVRQETCARGCSSRATFGVLADEGKGWHPEGGLGYRGRQREREREREK